MGYSEVLETRGDLRVVLINDEGPDEPYNDGGSPIVRLDHHRWNGWRAEHISSISDFKPEHIDRIEDAAGKWGSEHELFERYLRMFHGTTEIKWWDSRGNGGGDYVYVSFDTVEWREHLGITPGQTNVVDMAEWQSYCEGDVWGRRIERRRTYAAKDNPADEIEQWEPVEDGDLWGLYGRKYAEEEAREALNAEAA